MSISWNRSLKTGLATAGAAVALSMVVPATASADIVDDALARIPAGQISCEQAKQYWTTESEYNSYRTQAQAAALFHPRGGEIRDALARIDEAANRCGLKGGGNTGGNAGGNTGGNAGGNTGGNNAPAPAAPAAPGPAQSAPAPAPAAQNISLAAPGTPSFTIDIPGFGSLTLPDLYRIVAEFLAQFGIRI